MAKTTKRARKSKSKKKNCSCKRVPNYKICTCSENKSEDSLSAIPFSIAFINYLLSFTLWLASIVVLSYFSVILFTSTKFANTTTYAFDITNFTAPYLWAVFFYIVFIGCIYFLHKFNQNKFTAYILSSQSSQINFIAPVCFAVVLLVIDRALA